MSSYKSFKSPAIFAILLNIGLKSDRSVSFFGIFRRFPGFSKKDYEKKGRISSSLIVKLLESVDRYNSRQKFVI